MRAGIVASCVALALLLGGCSDYAMVRDGIGVNLAAADLPEASRLQTFMSEKFAIKPD